MRVRIKPQDSLLMDFLLKLDDGTCVWLQIRNERVFQICFSCGRIGHKADTYIWTREQIESSIHRQMRRLRNNFNINLGVNFTEAHFVNSTRAFSKQPGKRTTIIKRVIDNGQSIYPPF